MPEPTDCPAREADVRPVPFLGARWHVTGEHTIASGLEGTTPAVWIAIGRDAPITPGELRDLADRLNAGAHPPVPPHREPRLWQLLISLAWLEWRAVRAAVRAAVRVTRRGFGVKVGG